MGTMQQRLFDELLDRSKYPAYSCSGCNGIAYPTCWMTKTREKAVAEGALKQCASCSSDNIAWLIFPTV